MLEEEVKQLLQDALDENPSLFLIDLKIDSSNKIQVILDGDNGVSLNDCIAVSRAIEHNLDREEEDFALEVMSAGARSEEHTSEPQSRPHLVCRLLLEKKK